MSLSHKKLLKKKQKRQKKQQKRHKTLVPKALYELPIVAAWETECVKGMISICFVRPINNTDYHLAMYLIDLWSLGVKDAYTGKVSYEQYKELTEYSRRFNRAEPGRLKRLLLDAVAFGRENGFEPGGDYAKMCHFIKAISTKDAQPHGMTFGNDGEVTYVANPESESAKEIKTRLATLEKTLGAGNFHFVVPENSLADTDPQHSVQKIVNNGKAVDMKSFSAEKHKGKILATTTNELQMFVRLYYVIQDLTGLIKAFDKLKCVEYMDENVFHLNYHKEAKNFGLEVGYKKVPEGLFPIILGYGHFRNNKTELIIDIRSYKRALSMIKFIDNNISRKVLHLNEMATYNEVMCDPNLTFDDVFNDIKSNPQAELMEKLELIKQDISITEDERRRESKAILGEQVNAATPVVTKNPVPFYEDGIKGMEISLMMRQIIAQRHADGEVNYSAKDLIKEVVSSDMEG